MTIMMSALQVALAVYLAGIIVFAMVVLLADDRPPTPKDMPAWQVVVAIVVVLATWPLWIAMNAIDNLFPGFFDRWL